jgi:hypothetical protein
MLRRRVWAIACALLLGVLLFAPTRASASGADWDDDDEFDAPPARASKVDASRAPLDADDASPPPSDKRASRDRAFKGKMRERYGDYPPVFEWKYELLFPLLIAGYLAFYVVGDRKNRAIVRAWEEAHARPDGVLMKNFAIVGAGPEAGAGPYKGSMFTREGPDEYRLYATGRRFVKAAVVTLKMRNRTDPFALFFRYLDSKNKTPTLPPADPHDTCVVECVMRDDAGISPGCGFAFGTTRGMAKLEKVADDVARLMSVAVVKHRDGSGPLAGTKKTSNAVVVKAESSELASDVVSDVVCELALGEAAASSTHGKHLLHAHCANEATTAEYNRLGLTGSWTIRFAFRVPKRVTADAMREAHGELLKLVPHLVDRVARVRLSGAQKELAEKRRARRREEDASKNRKENQARSVHWSPYDPVGVVNADP